LLVQAVQLAVVVAEKVATEQFVLCGLGLLEHSHQLV
jgi:hypothetical protein